MMMPIKARNIGRVLSGLTLCALLAACAPATRVILLPQANGKPSAVDVQAGNHTQALTEPYQQADVGRSGQIQTGNTTAAEVEKNHPRLIALLPPTQERFVLRFETGSSVLTPESMAQLPGIIERARARQGGEIIVTGHTDRLGSIEANDQLSRQRAQAIRDLLIGQGFAPGLIEAVGRGEREPEVPTEDEVVEPRNRRAEIEVR